MQGPGIDDRSRATMESGRQVATTLPESLANGPVWERGSGSLLYGTNGKAYIDFTSGVLVTNVGHCHPHVVEAIQEQAARLLNCYDSPHILRTCLEQRLASLLPEGLQSIRLLTTGAEAVEAAIRTARRATGRSVIIGFQGAFHGRTYMAMSVGGLGHVKHGYGPLAASVEHAPFPYPYRCGEAAVEEEHDCSTHCLASLRRIIETELDSPPAAIVIEPYLGAGGSLVAPLPFARGIRQVCDELGAVMIVDEVQSSFCRTGTMFAFEQWAVQPDVVVVGKGIASGVPTSAVMMRTELSAAMPPGAFSSTFGGNPLSCAAALATLDVLQGEGLAERARRLGEIAMAGLRHSAETIPLIGDVRGMGMAIGVELVRDPMTKEPAVAEAKAAARLAIDRGVFVLQPIGLYGNVIRIAPPLTIDEDQLRTGLEVLHGSFRDAMN